jgi:hypothetical protein
VGGGWLSRPRPCWLLLLVLKASLAEPVFTRTEKVEFSLSNSRIQVIKWLAPVAFEPVKIGFMIFFCI